MQSFEELPIAGEIVRSLNELGFREMFPIQAAAIPSLLSGRDVIGQAKTGTGKTAAFGIPMIQQVDRNIDAVQGLVLVPTRELAVQVASDLNGFGKHLGVKSLAVYGGQPIYGQMEALQNTVHVVVGTPGRVIDHISRGTLVLDSVRMAVLDEADRMLDMGFREDIEYILSRTPSERQTAMFSATMPEEILDLTTRNLYNPEKILVSKDEIAVEEIEQLYRLVDPERKFQALCDILDQDPVQRALIFCSTKMGTDRLGYRLSKIRKDVAVIHGDLTQSQRERALDNFRHGRVRFLVATDVASRGLDIQGITHVINYDVPNDPLLYFHRIGRTGRAGASGIAVTLVSRREMMDLRRIQNMTHTHMHEMPAVWSSQAPRRPSPQGYHQPPWVRAEN
ncbi:MAG TPA: DEAD/DEAH box helicase [Candidatus Acidoferrales bacterium]|nr:DEAD/DEAH box helicase [Candidatus Acidoferrales bacterium]